jgi:hypothetical protein
MPRGISNPKPTEDTPPRKLTITLHATDYAALQELAAEQYRTPELQASFIVAKVLGEAARTSGLVNAVERNMQRALIAASQF